MSNTERVMVEVRIPTDEYRRRWSEKIVFRKYATVTVDYNQMKKENDIAKQRKTYMHRAHQARVTKNPRAKARFEHMKDGFILKR